MLDELSIQLREEALEVERNEPELRTLLHRTVLAPSVEASLEDAVASTVCYRLLLHPCREKDADNNNNNNNSHLAHSSTSSSTLSSGRNSPMFCPDSLRGLIREAMSSTDELEGDHTFAEALREDILAVCRRDPATDTILEVVLFSKGFSALVCHRAAFQLWRKRRKFTALFLQSQASAVFGLDLHPAAQIGAGVMLDHGTGVVVGETAVIGDGCTILHGVTLGGTGKDHGDRHPKIGRNVLIGAGSSILGNIRVGDGAKIGAGSVVLREIPAGATAVGAPAKIIGRATESKPGSDIDETLDSVSLLHTSESMKQFASRPSPTPSVTSVTESEETEEEDSTIDNRCPFREYVRLAKLAPPGTVTICTLGCLLKPLGCTHSEVGNCFFALDTRNVGHISKYEFRDRGVEAVLQNTRLNKDQAESTVSSYLNGRRNSCDEC